MVVPRVFLRDRIFLPILASLGLIDEGLPMGFLARQNIQIPTTFEFFPSLVSVQSTPLVYYSLTINTRDGIIFYVSNYYFSRRGRYFGRTSKFSSTVIVDGCDGHVKHLEHVQLCTTLNYPKRGMIEVDLLSPNSKLNIVPYDRRSIWRRT